MQWFNNLRRVRRRPGRAPLLALSVGAVAIVAAALLAASNTPEGPPVAQAVDCAKRYVAGGDHIPAGHEVSESERYPEQLLNNHLLPSPGPWCLLNTAKNETTSSTYYQSAAPNQLAQTWNYRPDLITLQVGQENATIINLVNSCFDKVKDHDFSGANVCAATILANSSLWTNYKNNLITIFQQYRMIMAGRPKLVVAVPSYPNPYPDALSVTPKIVQLCVPLIDTIPTCTARWAQFPPALITIDKVFDKLNATTKSALDPFTYGFQGRFVWVDVAPKFEDHCMEMKVEIKTKVEHPEQQGAVHDHNSPEVNFGCDDPWWVKGSDGTAKPNYLLPAALGILIEWSQTTKGMGTHPNADGHECIAEAIWEADTIHPGTTPLKWLLGVPQVANTSVCE